MWQKLKAWFGQKWQQFKGSKFFIFMLGLTIGATFIGCYFTIKYEYQDLFVSRIVIFNNSSVALASNQVDENAGANQEIEKVALQEVRGDEQSSPIVRLIEKTFPEDPRTAVAVATCESQLDPSRIGDTHMEFYSYGLFQVNQTWHKYSKETLLNAEENIKIARKIYDGAGWIRWACFTNGNYKRYL